MMYYFNDIVAISQSSGRRHSSLPSQSVLIDGDVTNPGEIDAVRRRLVLTARRDHVLSIIRFEDVEPRK
jgi:hypothetical protein